MAFTTKQQRGGARIGAGRKSKAEEAGLRELLSECWDDEARRNCIRELAVKASNGEMEAVKLLFAYTFGKPKEVVEHSSDPDAPVRLVVEYVNDWRGR